MFHNMSYANHPAPAALGNGLSQTTPIGVAKIANYCYVDSNIGTYGIRHLDQ